MAEPTTPGGHDTAADKNGKRSETTESSALALDSWSALLQPAALIAFAWTLTQIVFVAYPLIDTFAQRALHVGFALALAIAMIGRRAARRRARIAWAAFALVVFLPALYITLNVDYLVSGRIQGVDAVRPIEYAAGLLLLVVLFEVSRRVLGLGLAVFSAIFVAYFFLGPFLPGELSHRYTGMSHFIDSQFLSMQGIFGVPTAVSVSTVFYFILFAAVYDIYGGGRMIIELAFALTGRTVGGPAKAAVVSSGMLGCVSGSAVANVMSTGIFTIPLMMRVGYAPRFAGAVEAAASTGGQLVPPVMGAAAFIMADYLQMPYQTIVLAAILPAVVYYVALLLMVDLKARAEGLRPSAEAMQVKIGETLRSRGHLLLALAWLVWRIIAGYPVENAAIEACGVTLLVGTLHPRTRRGPLALIEAMVVSAERSVAVALPCALAGVVVAVIAYTGLGTKFTGMMLWLAAGQLPVLLVLTMLASLVLGTGMPTTSAYIMAAVLLAPAMIEIGAQPLTVHFFIFYFSILSMVTPPVALSAYAAASISRASPNETGYSAFMLSLPGFLIPFGAILHPGLLLMGSTFDAVWGLANVLLGFAGVCVAMIGWLFRPIGRGWRAYFLVVGLLTLLPDFWSTVVSVALLAAGTAWLWRDQRARLARPAV
ncbi:MAG: TRAP transporter fused permease subunit [Burkholderiales bacterium]|nr:TRAP transporter fused permease subunit [Burkholderiales bacterium]